MVSTYRPAEAALSTRQRKRPALPAVVLALLAASLLAVGCSSSGKTTAPAPARTRITVLAAASLTQPFTVTGKTLDGQSDKPTVRYSFGGSGALATQVENAVPADVIATADTRTMKRLVDAGLVETPRTFARNRLGILVAPGNPKQIKGLADLARTDLIVVLCSDDVPAGHYASEVLTKAGVSVSPKSLEPDVKAAVAKVTSGEADAAIVYVTDIVAAGDRGALVEIPLADNVVAEYPIAVIKATKHHSEAQQFVEAITGEPGQSDLRKAGFLPAA